MRFILVTEDNHDIMNSHELNSHLIFTEHFCEMKMQASERKSIVLH